MNLIEHIETDLRSHLKQGKAPASLTLKALATHYDVSPTPIRSVVERLIDNGLLIKHPNGRLQATGSVDAPAVSPKPSKPPEWKDDQFEIILREVVLNTLQEQKTFMREESTAARHGLSRFAVRRIFHRIATQGLLQHVPRRGWCVRAFSQDDLRDYIETRAVLELKALDLAKGKLLDIDLQEIFDGNILPKSSRQKPVIDNRLHAYLIDKSDNFYIQDFFERHATFFRILFEWEGENREAAIEAITQHHEILQAMLDRNWSRACKALNHHILNNHPVLAPDHREKMMQAGS